jgi:bisphosphoglycerate-independent phosphoglycerate mutase (AlkP superfamily)
MEEPSEEVRALLAGMDRDERWGRVLMAAELIAIVALFYYVFVR